jgi:hypothetical protein
MKKQRAKRSPASKKRGRKAQESSLAPYYVKGADGNYLSPCAWCGSFRSCGC